MNRRLKIWVAIGIVLGATIFIPVIRHYQLRFAVEKYISELKAKGEPMELAQVIPPPVPREKNGADVFRQAAALIDADESLSYSNYVVGMKMVAPGKAMVCFKQENAECGFTTNSWENEEAAVAQNQKSF